MNILIVDDEALARSRLRTLLTDCNADAPHSAPHVLTEAATAAEAMQQLAPTGGRGVDLALLDIHMPGQDGLGLAHQMRALAHPPAIVFVTAHTDHAVSPFFARTPQCLGGPARLAHARKTLRPRRRRRLGGAPARPG